ncbi:MAG: hypothetical protein ACFCUL_14385 [Flavobacteriaceae bacterium]
MKKTNLAFLLALVLTCYNLVAQQSDNLKSRVYISMGYPTFPDLTIQERNLFFSLGYQYKFAPSFGGELFLLNASANSKLDFFNDKSKVIAFLDNDIDQAFSIGRGNISTWASGLKLHWYFLNKKEHQLSFNFGAGYYLSSSTKQSLPEVVYQIDPIRILDVTPLESSGQRNKFFITPGFSYNFDLHHGFGVGIEAMALFEQSSEGIIIVPVIPNFYALSFALTKRF